MRERIIVLNWVFFIFERWLSLQKIRFWQKVKKKNVNSFDVHSFSCWRLVVFSFGPLFLWFFVLVFSTLDYTDVNFKQHTLDIQGRCSNRTCQTTVHSTISFYLTLLSFSNLQIALIVHNFISYIYANISSSRVNSNRTHRPQLCRIIFLTTCSSRTLNNAKIIDLKVSLIHQVCVCVCVNSLLQPPCSG